MSETKKKRIIVTKSYISDTKDEFKKYGFDIQDANILDKTEVANIIKDLFETDIEDKIKLYLAGKLLTDNKNKYIHVLQTQINKLQATIHNQRKYINKLITKYVPVHNQSCK